MPQHRPKIACAPFSFEKPIKGSPKDPVTPQTTGNSLENMMSTFSRFGMGGFRSFGDMAQYLMLSEFLSFCGHCDAQSILKHRLASDVNVGSGPGRAGDLGPRGFPHRILPSSCTSIKDPGGAGKPTGVSSHLLASPKTLKLGSLRTAESMVIGYDGA
ncbi:hypothetical protein STEG23_007914 [Scotinomys teguina]